MHHFIRIFLLPMLLYILMSHTGCGVPERYENPLGMSFIRIEAGSFTMGQADGEFDELPVHEVTISRPFLMSETEVTNARYELFDPDHKALRGKHGISLKDDEPVVNVSWEDAAAFCEWLSGRDGRKYRLPTEAEWEYACRAGTSTAFSTGDSLDVEYQRAQKENWGFEPVDLRVTAAPPNQWGLYGMHGGVEEWCYDWYGPYAAKPVTDPVGPADGDFRVTRGGSHNTKSQFLRSANRMGALPGERNVVIGFRVVIGEIPGTKPLPEPEPGNWSRDVSQTDHVWDQPSEMPFFKGPVSYVNVPPGSNGPLYSHHNHCPAITVCPNGDVLAVWYTTNEENGRELAIAASRFRRETEEWDPPSLFWDGPDRNDHASDLLWDSKHTLYHFNGISSDATWGKLALIMRTSTDNGAHWSKARIIMPEHGLRHMPVAGVFMTKDGSIIQPSDAVTIGHGGTAVVISRDGGTTWYDPGEGKAAPEFKAGGSGAWIAGIHAGVVERNDGSLMAFGRGDDIDGRMPMSLSTDLGESWTYSAGAFPPINGGQRLVLLRLREGPIMLISFTDTSAKRSDPDWPAVDGITVRDSAGKAWKVYGMFAALSFDEGKTWPVKKLVTPGTGRLELDGGAWTDEFVLDDTHAEPMGYLAATEAPDGTIHLISSALHYRFNLAWLKEPMSGK